MTHALASVGSLGSACRACRVPFRTSAALSHKTCACAVARASARRAPRRLPHGGEAGNVGELGRVLRTTNSMLLLGTSRRASSDGEDVDIGEASPVTGAGRSANRHLSPLPAASRRLPLVWAATPLAESCGLERCESAFRVSQALEGQPDIARTRITGRPLEQPGTVPSTSVPGRTRRAIPLPASAATTYAAKELSRLGARGGERPEKSDPRWRCRAESSARLRHGPEPQHS